MHRSTIQAILAIMFAVFGSANVASSAVFDYAFVMDGNTLAPGGTGRFTGVLTPGISGGNVLFRATSENGGDGIYLFQNATLEMLVDINTPIPGGTGTFTRFTTPSLDPHVNVAFRGEGGVCQDSSMPCEQVGVYTLIDGNLSVLADMNTDVPGTEGAAQFTDFGTPWIYNREVVFRAYGTGGLDGIYTNAGGTLRVVADTASNIPNGTGTFARLGSDLGTRPGSPPSIQEGDIAFIGGGQAGSGVYAEIDGSLVRIADKNIEIPGFPGFQFDNFPIGRNTYVRDGEIVFMGEGPFELEGLYKYANGQLSVIVDQTTVNPATGGTLQNIAPQGIGFDNENVSFLGQDSVSGSSTTVFAVLDGQLTPVVTAGDVIDGRTIVGPGTYGQGMENGSVAFAGGGDLAFVAIQEHRWHGTGSPGWETVSDGKDWDDPGNWPYGLMPREVVPTIIAPAGSVTIIGPAHDCTIASMQIGGGTGIANLRLQNGARMTSLQDVRIMSTGALSGEGVIGSGIINDGLIEPDNISYDNNLQNNGEIRLTHADARLSGGQITNNGEIRLDDQDARITTMEMVNGGLVRGSGRIIGPLNNLANGEVRVRGGERLVVTSGSNGGHIEVLGNRGSSQGAAELEINAQLTNIAGGDIIARDATLRFRGGLANGGRLLFSGGLNDVFGPVNLTGGAGGGEIIVSGQGTATFYGPVDHNGDEIRVSAGSTLVFFGDLSGAGPITCTGGSPGLTCPGNVFIEAGFFPGNSPAAVFIGPSVSLGPDALLEMELGGTAPGSEHDQLNIGGTATLSGTLDIQVIDGFAPRVGDSFTILTYAVRSGTFDAVTSTKGYVWDVDYAADAVTITATAVPEPATWLLAATGLIGIGLLTRRRRGCI